MASVRLPLLSMDRILLKFSQPRPRYRVSVGNMSSSLYCCVRACINAPKKCVHTCWTHIRRKRAGNFMVTISAERMLLLAAVRVSGCHLAAFCEVVHHFGRRSLVVGWGFAVT